MTAHAFTSRVDSTNLMRNVIRKIGLLGFTFFLVKGLVWLALLGGGAAAIRGCGGAASTAAAELAINTVSGASENGS